jgi:hypothetical protein
MFECGCTKLIQEANVRIRAEDLNRVENQREPSL